MPISKPPFDVGERNFEQGGIGLDFVGDQTKTIRRHFVAGAFAGARARCRWSSEHERALSEGGGGGCHVLCMVLVDVPPAALNAALRALGASLLRALQPFTVSMTLYYSRGYLARRPACGDTVDCSVLEYVSNFSVDVVTARGVRATPFARLLVPGPLAALDVHALPAGVVVDAAPGADVYEASFAPRRSAFGGYFCRQTTPTLRDACVLTVRMPYALCADAVRGGGVAFRRANSVQVVVAGGVLPVANTGRLQSRLRKSLPG